MTLFDEQILQFNSMYRLPAPTAPTTQSVGDVAARLKAFKNILREELDEIDEIVGMIEGDKPVAEIDVLVALADLLGDVQVYCASEMRKFGLPNGTVLELIMASNFSKLGADGQPIYDERGKVQKGPNYWKPEPSIKMILERIGLQPKVV